MQVLQRRVGGATALCAALAFGPVLVPVHAMAQSVGDTQPADNAAPESALSGVALPNRTAGNAAAEDAAPEVNLGQARSALVDSGLGHQGVPVPHTHGRAIRHVDVRANAGVTYDSNASRSNALRPGRENVNKSDFIFPVGVSADIVIPSGASLYSLSGRVGYDFNLRNTRLNSENVGVSGGYGRAIGRCSAGLNGAIARRRTQFSESGFEDFSKNLQTLLSVGGSLSCDVGAGIRPFGSFNYATARNSIVRRQFSDHNTKVFGGGILKDFPTLGEIGLVASMEETDYPNRVRDGLSGAERFKVKSIGISYDRHASRIWQARIQLNYTSVDTGVAAESFHGLSGNARVQFMPGGRINFSLDAARTASASLSFNSDYNLTTSYGITASGRITARANARIGYQHIHRELVGGVGLPGEAVRSDDTSTITGAVNFRVNRRISTTFSLVQESRSSDNVLFDYSGLRGTIAVSVRI